MHYILKDSRKIKVPKKCNEEKLKSLYNLYSSSIEKKN